MTESAAILTRAGLDELVVALRDDGYQVIGPVRRDDAIVLAELRSGADLPSGWGVDTAPGSYRLRRRDDQAVFGHSAGPGSWKQFLHPPRQQLWQAQGGAEPPSPYAFLGGDRDPRHRAWRRSPPRQLLHAQAGGIVRRRRGLHRTGRRVLLRIDGHGPAAGSRL